MNLANYHFEDFVREANSATSAAELFSALLKTVKKHGLDRAIFSLSTDHDDLDQKADFGIVHNYPQDWLKHYNENEYKYIDPVMVYGATTIDTFKWDDIPKRFLLSKKQKLILDLGGESGLHNGVCTPLRGVNNQLAGIALATTESRDAYDGNIDLINAYCNHFYLAYRRLHKKTKNDDQKNVCLTEREREVLKWMAIGKTNYEIGEILKISENTVDTHIRKIFDKLDAHNRILASVKAINMGLIHV